MTKVILVVQFDEQKQIKHALESCEGKLSVYLPVPLPAVLSVLSPEWSLSAVITASSLPHITAVSHPPTRETETTQAKL